MELLKAANKYIQVGLSVVATDANKRALFSWKKYQQQIISSAEISEQLSHAKAAGLAVICGTVSGGLEVVDVDLKNDISGTLWQRLFDALADAGLIKLLKIAKTKSGGYHLYYRCEVIEGNKKLSLRAATPAELKDNPQLKQVVIIETRGEAGYVIAPPTPGYEWTEGTLHVLSIDQRDCLLEICRSFNEAIEMLDVPISGKPDAKSYGISPFEQYNKTGDVVELLVQHGWSIVKRQSNKVVFKRPGTTDSKSSGDYNYDLGWFSVFTTNSIFEPNKAYQPYAVFAMLECKGNFKDAAKKLLDMGYGERRESYGGKMEKEVFKKKSEGYTKEDLVKYVKNQKKCEEDEAESIIESLEQQWGQTICTFWDVDKNGKPIINRRRLEKFLSQTGGFYLYFHDTSTIYRLIRAVDGVVEESSTEQVKKFVKTYIESLPDTFDGGVTPDELLEVVYKGSEAYFNNSFFEFLERKKFDFLKDDDRTAYLPFKNGIVLIPKNGSVQMKSYGELKKAVWKNQIIDFNISIDQDFDASLCEYARFVNNISGKDENKFGYSLSLMGYMLHNWKDPARPFAPILAEETDDESKGGGTGKGIFIKALSYLIPTVRIDGKNFKIDKNFAFQRVTLGTRLVVIEDCPKGLDFEKYYPTITEGITIEKKNKDELFLHYADSPKIAFTTNYSISQSAEHAKRRQRVLEFTSHYSSRYTPQDEFGHKLFDDWDADEWNRFYNLLFTCIGMYLDAGIKELPASDKMKVKHIKNAFGEEFYEWWEDFEKNGKQNWHVFAKEYENFIESNKFEKRDFSVKRFRKGLVIASHSFGMVYKTQRNRQNNNMVEFSVHDS
jgi:hypothetical protein